MRALQLAQSVPWAIRPEALQLILEIAAREHTPDFVAAAERLEARRREIETDAVSGQQGTRLEGARAVVMRGDTAVLPIEGPISRYANLFSDISGGTSVEMLAKDLKVALDSPAVASILMHVDSPGGEVNGTGELSDILYAARGSKPIWAYVSHQGASAAYWLASAADRIIVAPTALVGSIGVIATVPDPTRQPGDDFQFVSSQSPKKRPDPNTKGGKAQIQTVVDDLASVFVDSVARNRGVSAQTVLDDFGGGDVMVGANAVTAGLADAVGSFEQCLIDIQNPDSPAVPPVQVQPAKPERRRRPMSGISERFDNLMALLGGQASAEDVGDMAPPDSPPAERATVGRQAATSAETAARRDASVDVLALERQQREALEQRLAAAEAENRRIRAERIGELASAFAERQIVAGHAFPAESAQIVALYTMAATDDANLGPIRQSDGTTNSRVASVVAAYEARPSHNLTREQMTAATAAQALQTLANLEKTPGTGNEPPTQDERDALLSKTVSGRAILAGRNGKN
jgi:capsid assembly protease